MTDASLKHGELDVDAEASLVSSLRAGQGTANVPLSSTNPRSELGGMPVPLLILSLIPGQGPGWEGPHPAAGRAPHCLFLASRPDFRLHPWQQGPGPTSPRLLWFQVYVQDLLRQRLASEVLRVLREEHGHLYVCGDVRMARDVARTLKGLVAAELSLSEEQVEDYFFQLKVGQLLGGLGIQLRDPGRGAQGPGES